MSLTLPYLVRPAVGGPDLIERAKSQTLSIEIRSNVDGQPATLTASGSSVSIYDPRGNAVVSGGTVTVSGGVASYALSSSTVPVTLALESGWRAVWVLVVDGVAQTFTRDMALCRYVPTPSVTPDDLYARHSDLPEQIPSAQDAVGYYPQINEAWKEISQRLVDKGRRPWLIVTAGSVRRVHLYLTLALIYGDFATRMTDSRYQERADNYMGLYERAWDELRFEYDRDEDGLSDGQQSATPVIYLGAGPRTGGLGGWYGRQR